jgi:hypothetical protein
MLKRGVLTGLLATIALGAALTELTDARLSPICTRGNTTVEVDPRGLLPLTGVNPIGSATNAALRYMRASSRPQVVSAALATRDQQRGRQAKFSCGRRVWQRSVVVYITARAALPAQSASQRVFFVGRFKSGYRVWQVVH